ncbi:hypothetical protein JTB14_014285 [Gonioctena quinquepunctata]|nr:hypothetical protein JTB14_014285 [Gonioctena quinquepunctata]
MIEGTLPIVFLPTAKMCATRIIISFLLIGFLEVLSEREHSVHNIVLYPEKQSWCQITPIQQIIASPGYETVTIDNNVCVGACFSYAIPKTQPAEAGELIGPYCDSCQPSAIECYHVNLREEDNNIEGPKISQKRVQIITKCSCKNCDKIGVDDCEITDGSTVELPYKLYTKGKEPRPGNDDLPDILEAKSSHTHNHDTGDVLNEEKNKKWLKSHHDEVENLYRLFMEQNRENNAEIEEGTESYETPDGELSNSLHKKHHDESNAPIMHSNPIRLLDNKLERNQENNAKIRTDLKNVADNFGVEGVPSGLKALEKTSDAVDHPNVIPVPVVMDEEKYIGGSSEHHPHHHNHHSGEVDYVGMNVVHLVKGPHGSLVAAPVETKLEIDSDALKPNGEGVVIDYGSPHGMNVVHLVKGPHGNMVAAPLDIKLEIHSVALKPNGEEVVIDYGSQHGETPASSVADLFK